MKSYFHVSPITGKRTGIKEYEYGENYITIHFTSGSFYTYTTESCGKSHLLTMKHLADAQSGLNTYLTKHKPPYSEKH